MIIVQFAILIYSIILHEISHGWVADRLGDPTARLSKRLTLDPRPHIDLFMTILLPLLLVLTGSPIIFGAAKPVPVDSFNFREPKKDMALTAAAGPVTNLLIALIFSFLFRLGLFPEVCIYAATINVILAVFNLLPIPPLDGAKVLAGILPDEAAALLLGLERFGLTLVILILFLFGPLIDGVIMPLSRTILRLLFF